MESRLRIARARSRLREGEAEPRLTAVRRSPRPLVGEEPGEGAMPATPPPAPPESRCWSVQSTGKGREWRRAQRAGDARRALRRFPAEDTKTGPEPRRAGPALVRSARGGRRPPAHTRTRDEALPYPAPRGQREGAHPHAPTPNHRSPAPETAASRGPGPSSCFPAPGVRRPPAHARTGNRVQTGTSPALRARREAPTRAHPHRQRSPALPCPPGPPERCPPARSRAEPAGALLPAPGPYRGRGEASRHPRYFVSTR
jgi:hypothetical protein